MSQNPTPEDQVNMSAPATSVDMASVTAQSPDATQLVEQPMPGRPDRPQAVIDQVVQDLQARIKAGADEITVADVKDVEWPDTGLGCPAPGQGYAEVLTPGYQIVLEARSQRYVYHADRATSFVLCQNGQPAS